MLAGITTKEDDGDMNQKSSASRRPLLIAVGVVAAIVIIALAVVFSRGEPEALDPSTPEGTVQQYVQAIMADDTAAARQLLTAAHQDDCIKTESYNQDGTRVTLDASTERGDSATVDVIITHTDGGALSSGDYSYDARFHLDREGGAWAISGTPWDFTVCEGTAQ